MRPGKTCRGRSSSEFRSRIGPGRAWTLASHFPPACRGQALLVAVLVLFAVATLAALFAAIIGSQIVQVGRHSDMVELRNIAEAGLNYANEQLTYGIEGADWRPGQSSYRCGRGQFSLTVDYGPDPTRVQSRFVRVISTAIFPEDPFLRHTILALKPLLLTDYGRFITDRFDSKQAACLGSPSVEIGSQPRAGYVFTTSGPLRSNTDLVWYGASRVDLYNSASRPEGVETWQELGILRDDRIEVAGEMRPADLRGQALDSLALAVHGTTSRETANLFWPLTAAEQQDYLNGYLDPNPGQPGQFLPNTWRLLADLPLRQVPPDTLYPPYLSVPRVRPPDIEAVNPDLQINRYYALTRDSGEWLSTGGAWINSGRFGWGWTNFGGIYVDNGTEIQYQHDLEKLRLNWVGSVGVHQAAGAVEKGDNRPDGTAGPLAGPADWWDKTGRHYAPPGVEIIFHGEDLACPYLEMIRHDAKTTGTDTFYWQEPNGTPIITSYTYVPVPGKCWPRGTGEPVHVMGARALFPFPANGVIYAEGNVRIKGIAPPVRIVNGYPQGYRDADKYDDDGCSRRFDITVVSGGTIYIEDNLLTPRGAGLLVPGQAGDYIDTIAEDIKYGSRIALLARDYVCVNTTALNPRPQEMFEVVADPDDPNISYWYNDRYPNYPPGGYPRYVFLQGPTDDVINSDDPGAENWDEEPISTVPGGLSFSYSNVRLQHSLLRQGLADLRLILGHSGWYELYAEDPQEDNLPASGAQVEVQLMIDPRTAPGQTPRYWEGGTEDDWYAFVPPPADPTQNQSEHWYADQVDYLEFLPDSYQGMVVHDPAVSPPVAPLLSGDDVITFSSRITPVREKDEQDKWHWVVRPKELGYIPGPVVVAPPNHVTDADGNVTVPPALPVQIQALVYAQTGSWFVIPGAWFNEDPDEGDEDADYTRGYPGYHEPLNTQISFQGAISENMPAPLGDMVEWTSKWAGPAGANTASFLRYDYDALLRQSDVRDSQGRLYPRFRRLPMTPDLLIWGERISGQAGP